MSILDLIVEKKLSEVEKLEQKVPMESLIPVWEQRCQLQDFRSLQASLTQPGIQVIAEIKKASPSKGIICADLNVEDQAHEYERGGACALSVLTEREYFLGKPEDLQKARSSVTLPVLRKDFIVKPYQIYESAALGADAILLIVRILKDAELEELLRLSHELHLEALVEIHDVQDWLRVQHLKPALVGINNRDLSSFHTDLSVAMDLVDHMQNFEGVSIALSGIQGPEDIRLNLKAGISRFLVGESLVRAPSASLLLQQLRSTRLE